jgi:hypothetical protein
MKKIFIALILIAFLSACVLLEMKEENQTIQQNTEQQNQNNEEIIPEETDLNELIELTLQEKIDLCLEKEVIAKNDCLHELGVKEKKIEVCNLMDLQAGYCIKEIAFELNDSKLCEKINESTPRNECFEFFASDIGLIACNQIKTTQEKDDCYHELAVQNSNYFICKKISASFKENQYRRDKCLSEVLKSVKVIDLCELFQKNALKQNCYMETGKENLDVNACNKIELKENAIECRTYVAENSTEEEKCFLFEENELKNKCFNSVAVNSNNEKICSEINNTDKKDICFNELADNNPELCSEINSIKLRDECYLNNSIKLNDANYCSKISKITNNWNECFYTIALNTNNYFLCENIFLPEKYLECFTEIGIKLKKPEICLTMNKNYFTQYSKYPLTQLCYKELAIKLNLNYLCDEIKNEELINACNDRNTAFH